MLLKSSQITFLKKFAVKLKSPFINNVVNGLVVKELEVKFNDIIDNYKTKKSLPKTKQDSKVIWFCWFQGIDKAPLLVKKCLYNLELNKPNGYEIKIITENNYHQYIDLPHFIKDKFSQDIISKTHLSDIIRFSLLAKYGGLWIDSTILILKNLDEVINNNVFLTLKNNTYYKYTSISNGLWTSYFIKASSNDPGIEFIKDCLIKYWETEKEIFDYYMLDYIILLTYKHFPELRNNIKNNSCYGNNRYLLKNLMNYPVNSEDTQKLQNDPLKIYKLNNKTEYIEYTSEGKETYYKKFINN